MNSKKRFSSRGFFGCIGFIAIFLVILTFLTMIFIPKWERLDAELMRSFYTEEENTIDVLMLGSCNMYSSYSPVVAYEQYGISSAVFACPDQEYITAYHYLVDALKSQDIKLVVLEALFLTCEPTAKREYYNRTALEYMPPSLNKAQAILDLSKYESEYMQTVDPTAADTLLTNAGYFFPLLRYHGREDLTGKDIDFYFERNDAKAHKGASALYSYLNNSTLDFAVTVNGSEVRDISREYFIKIQELCEKEGIEFLFVKSPNHYRWNDEISAVVQEFAQERQVDFLDMHSYDDFILTDYSSTTGRLNIYGMKKFTEHLCEYIQENYSYTPSLQTDSSLATWEDCVATVHQTANEKGMTIDQGKIYNLYNEETGIRLLWNHCFDASSYEVYRSPAEEDNFQKIAVTSETTYLDEAVEPQKIYLYRIVPTDGVMAGTYANERRYAFVEMPLNLSAENYNGGIQLTWDASASASYYQIQRKPHANLNYEKWDTTKELSYWNKKCNSGTVYDYRIRAVFKDGDNYYYSYGNVASRIALSKPQITSVQSKDGTNVISWEKLSGAQSVQIYRRASYEDNWVLYDTIKADTLSYTDANIESDIQYFYEIVALKTAYGIDGYSRSNQVGVFGKK